METGGEDLGRGSFEAQGRPSRPLDAHGRFLLASDCACSVKTHINLYDAALASAALAYICFEYTGP